MLIIIAKNNIAVKNLIVNNVYEKRVFWWFLQNEYIIYLIISWERYM